MTLFLVASAIAGSGLLSDQPAASLSPAAARMLSDIEVLASDRFAGRGVVGPANESDGVRNNHRAGRWVAAQMRAIGLQPLFPGDDGTRVWEQAIPGGTTPLSGINIGGVLPGSDPDAGWVLVTAHHDHLGTVGKRVFRGADDNASGTAMVLEVARQMMARTIVGKRPRCSVAFVTFDLEERMLFGSRYFASHAPMPLDAVRLFITADMLGRHLGGLQDIDEVFVMGSESAATLRERVVQASQQASQPVALLAADIVGTRSDYGPFRDAEVPFLFFSTGEHPDYHTPGDVPEKIDAARAARIMQVIVDIALDEATAEQPMQWSPQSPDGLAEARVLHRISVAVLAADAEGSRDLPVVQRLLVERVKSETEAMIAAETVSPSQRSWIKTTARLMLLSVF